MPPKFPSDEEELQAQVNDCTAIWGEAMAKASLSVHAEIFLFTVLQLVVKTMKLSRKTPRLEAEAYLQAALAKIYSAELEWHEREMDSTARH